MEEYIIKTKKWLDEWVIGHNLCPFASRVVKKEELRIICSKAKSEEALLPDFIEEIELLISKTPEEIETTLIVLPFVLADFNDYLDFTALAEGVLERFGLEGVLQLATFHPQYQFEGSEPDDRSNYTNRSPYPMLHLLREGSVETALANYKEPEDIPVRNIALLEGMSEKAFRANPLFDNNKRI